MLLSNSLEGRKCAENHTSHRKRRLAQPLQGHSHSQRWGPLRSRLSSKDPAYPGMKGIAQACLIRLEWYFHFRPEVAELYRNFMAEYLQLDHMAKVPDDQVTKLFSSYTRRHLPRFARLYLHLQRHDARAFRGFKAFLYFRIPHHPVF